MMNVDQELVSAVVRKILAVCQETDPDPYMVPVGVSNRHIHVTQEDLETLFGPGYQLTKLRDLMGDDFAAKETVTLIGPSLKPIENVRILGPVRKHTQVEISRNDTFILGVKPPVRASGDIAGSAPMTVVGPKGVLQMKEGCIIANRHIHMTPAEAQRLGFRDGDTVSVETGGERRTKFYDVQIRVGEKFRYEMHIDTDDANAVGLGGSARVKIVKE